MTNPIIVNYIFLGLTLLTTFLLFRSVKREIDARSQRERQRTQEMLDRLKAAAPPPPSQEPQETMAPLALAQSGFNLNKRVHAIRMVRRGEDISHIAAVLGVPRREVELLLRVHAMSSQNLTRKTAAGGN